MLFLSTKNYIRINLILLLLLAVSINSIIKIELINYSLYPVIFGFILSVVFFSKYIKDERFVTILIFLIMLFSTFFARIFGNNSFFSNLPMLILIISICLMFFTNFNFLLKNNN